MAALAKNEYAASPLTVKPCNPSDCVHRRPMRHGLVPWLRISHGRITKVPPHLRATGAVVLTASHVVERILLPHHCVKLRHVSPLQGQMYDALLLSVTALRHQDTCEASDAYASTFDTTATHVRSSYMYESEPTAPAYCKSARQMTALGHARVYLANTDQQ